MSDFIGQLLGGQQGVPACPYCGTTDHSALMCALSRANQRAILQQMSNAAVQLPGISNVFQPLAPPPPFYHGATTVTVGQGIPSLGVSYGTWYEARKPDPIEHAGITVGEITAWRCWETHDGFLKSVHMDSIWPPGEPLTDDGKLEASDYHSSGIHAWRTKAEALQYGSDSGKMVVGEVALWGEVVEHEHGYRAQFAKPLAIHYAVGNVSQIELQAIAINYGIPAKGGGMFDAAMRDLTHRDPTIRWLSRLNLALNVVMAICGIVALSGLIGLVLKATGHL